MDKITRIIAGFHVRAKYKPTDQKDIIGIALREASLILTGALHHGKAVAFLLSSNEGTSFLKAVGSKIKEPIDVPEKTLLKAFQVARDKGFQDLNANDVHKLETLTLTKKTNRWPVSITSKIIAYTALGMRLSILPSIFALYVEFRQAQGMFNAKYLEAMADFRDLVSKRKLPSYMVSVFQAASSELTEEAKGEFAAALIKYRNVDSATIRKVLKVSNEKPDRSQAIYDDLMDMDIQSFAGIMKNSKDPVKDGQSLARELIKVKRSLEVFAKDVLRVSSEEQVETAHEKLDKILSTRIRGVVVLENVGHELEEQVGALHDAAKNAEEDEEGHDLWITELHSTAEMVIQALTENIEYLETLEG